MTHRKTNTNNNPMMMSQIANMAMANMPNMGMRGIPPQNMAMMTQNQNQNQNNNKNINMAMMNMAGGGKAAASVQEFQRAASDIACYNDNPSSVFSTLKSVAKKLLKDDIRYRTLDTTNPKVMERLIGFEGVLDFLMLLGFESDAMGMKLVCEQKPTQQIVRNAIEVLNGYESRLGVGKQRILLKKNLGDGGSSSDGGLSPIGGSGSTAGGPQQLSPQSQQQQQEEDTLTLEQIILWSTHENMRDTDTMETLIITHKTITDSVTFIKHLRRRFFVPIPNNIRNDEKKVSEFRVNVQKRIQLKVIKSLRDWMKQYWDEDFSILDENNAKTNISVQKELEAWLKELDQHSTQSRWIGPLADTVSKEYQRFKLKEKNGVKIKHLEPLPTFDDVVIPKKIAQNNLNCDDLADQITLMDYRIFSRIEARECIGQSWKKKNNKALAPNILGLIQQFNYLTVFIQIQVLRERSLKERGKALKRVIKMGERLRELRNYNSLCAVYSALNSAPIHRLKLAWKRVPEKHLLMFENFKVIFARDFNHRNLRQLFRNSPAPSIPHIGLFLQDLVFIDDGNSTKIEIDNFKQHGSMVNFNKCVRITDRIKNIRLYQSHSYSTIKQKAVLQKLLLNEFQKLKDVTEDQIWDMSSEIKKQDEKDSKKNWIQ